MTITSETSRNLSTGPETQPNDDSTALYKHSSYRSRTQKKQHISLVGWDSILRVLQVKQQSKVLRNM
ncbi:hypothetical protein NQZ68_012918 [Dissostichus eleginoides]|nr:hypothetical protein NQZ68_012918 [Dissostichus eleginoides]